IHLSKPDEIRYLFCIHESKGLGKTLRKRRSTERDEDIIEIDLDEDLEESPKRRRRRSKRSDIPSSVDDNIKYIISDSPLGRRLVSSYQIEHLPAILVDGRCFENIDLSYIEVIKKALKDSEEQNSLILDERNNLERMTIQLKEILKKIILDKVHEIDIKDAITLLKQLRNSVSMLSTHLSNTYFNFMRKYCLPCIPLALNYVGEILAQLLRSPRLETLYGYIQKIGILLLTLYDLLGFTLFLDLNISDIKPSTDTIYFVGYERCKYCRKLIEPLIEVIRKIRMKSSEITLVPLEYKDVVSDDYGFYIKRFIETKFYLVVNLNKTRLKPPLKPQSITIPSVFWFSQVLQPEIDTEKELTQDTLEEILEKLFKDFTSKISDKITELLRILPSEKKKKSRKRKTKQTKEDERIDEHPKEKTTYIQTTIPQTMDMPQNMEQIHINLDTLIIELAKAGYNAMQIQQILARRGIYLSPFQIYYRIRKQGYTITELRKKKISKT
ncbi:MAG: hypothetical protein Q6363_005315, partial [Candidatus Njordarchaeota archaeon]